ncbi:MAG: Membrane protein, partial [bacterium]
MSESAGSGRGTTRHLIELSAGYFVSYVATGILVKYFTRIRRPPMSELAYLVNNTAGSSVLALVIVLILGWYRLRSNGPVTVAGIRMPAEYLYIIPSGICTAVIIPT